MIRSKRIATAIDISCVTHPLLVDESSAGQEERNRAIPVSSCLPINVLDGFLKMQVEWRPELANQACPKTPGRVVGSARNSSGSPGKLAQQAPRNPTT